MIRLPPGDTPAPDPRRKTRAAEHRRRLLEHNRERIEFAYEKSLCDGMDDPVVIVLDIDDERAARLAVATGLTQESVDSWREECGRRKMTPTQILAAPRWAVLCVVGPMTPNSPSGIVRPNPPDTFRVLAIARGGIAFSDFPMPPVSSLEM